MRHIEPPRLALLLCAAVLPAASIAAPLAAQEQPFEPPTHREEPDDPPAPDRLPRPQVPVAPPPIGGTSTGVQVNVDALGANIPGDAANEPSIAVDPTAPNRMVIGWRQFDTTASNFRQAGWGYSDDGGRSWTFPGVIEPGVFRSDPVLDFDSAGNFFYMSLTQVGQAFVCDLFKSTDGGQSWDGGVPAFGGDKEWFTIDRTGGPSDGNVYHVWSPFFSCCAGFFTRSYDGGQTFTNPVDLPVDIFWGTPAVGPGGELYVCGVDTSFTPLVTKSSSVQNPMALPTFEQTVAVDLDGTVESGSAPNPGGLSGQVQVAVDSSGGPTHGNVYLLSTVDPTGPDPLDVSFARSTDGGASWSAPVRVNDDPLDNFGWQWFGTMSVAPNGRIDVIWNDTRLTGMDNMSNLFYASSSDGGVSWSANQVLSPTFDSHVGWPNQNKIGDYYEMISDDVGAHLAWAATFNGEQDVYYLRIGDYDCNGNGIGDAQDLLNATSQDCNANDIPDECEIAAGAVDDANRNGVPDDCELCAADCGDGDGQVDVVDLLALLSQWGGPGGCDLNGSGTIDVNDLLDLLAAWGPC